MRFKASFSREDNDYILCGCSDSCVDQMIKTVLQMSTRSFVESIPAFCFTAWYSSLSVVNMNKLNKSVNVLSKIAGQQQHSMTLLCESRVAKRGRAILSDVTPTVRRIWPVTIRTQVQVPPTRTARAQRVYTYQHIKQRVHVVISGGHMTGVDAMWLWVTVWQLSVLFFFVCSCLTVPQKQHLQRPNKVPHKWERGGDMHTNSNNNIKDYTSNKDL